MFEIIKKIIIGLLAGVPSASNHTKCVSLSNQKCKIQLTFINLHPNKYSQGFHYYPFTVKLGKCVGSCNTLNDLFNKVCVPNKTEDLNLSMFKMITGINESINKNIIQIIGGIMINVSVKSLIYAKKNYIWNPNTYLQK